MTFALINIRGICLNNINLATWISLLVPSSLTTLAECLIPNKLDFISL